MLIVCTHDLVIRADTLQPSASAWGTTLTLNTGQDQEGAGIQLGQALANLRLNEPLCLAAHQNGSQFGDVAGQWLWSADDLAEIIQNGLPNDFSGPIMVYAVSSTAATFPEALATALGGTQTLCGGKVYGFNTPITDVTPFPSPQTLSTNASLTGTSVKC